MNDWILLVGLLTLFIGLSGCVQPTAWVQQKESDVGHQIPAEDLTVVEGLFQKNGINIGFFQITHFAVNEKVGDNPEAMYYSVGANQVYKGLPVFFENVIYGFNKEGEKVYGTDRRLISNNARDISTAPQITKEEAASKVIAEHGGAFDLNNLMAELGLHNRMIGQGVDAYYILAWKITVGDSEYPYAVVDADSGQILMFDNGIRTLLP